MRVNEHADNVTVDESEVADPADAWVQAGSGLPSDGRLHDVDGIPTTRSDGVAVVPAGHANGVLAIDRVTLRHHELGISVPSAMTSAHIRDC